MKVLKMIGTLFKDYKPLLFFSIWSLILLLLGLAAGTPVIVEFFQTQYITKVPSAILAVGLITLAMLSFASGLILDTVASVHRKQYELELNRIKESMGGTSDVYQVKSHQ